MDDDASYCMVVLRWRKFYIDIAGEKRNQNLRGEEMEQEHRQGGGNYTDKNQQE